MKLLHNVERDVIKGNYVLLADIDNGTVTVEISIEGSAFVPVDTVYTTSVAKQLPLPTCSIRAVITGTAATYLANTEAT